MIGGVASQRQRKFQTRPAAFVGLSRIANGVSRAAYTLAPHTNTRLGDLLLFSLQCSAAVTVVPPAGWTALVDGLVVDDTLAPASALRTYLYCKKYEGEVNFTFTANVAGTYTAILSTLRGVLGQVVVNTTSAVGGAGAANSVSASITPVNPLSVIYAQHQSRYIGGEPTWSAGVALEAVAKGNAFAHGTSVGDMPAGDVSPRTITGTWVPLGDPNRRSLVLVEVLPDPEPKGAPVFPTALFHFNGAEGGTLFTEDGGRAVTRVGTGVTSATSDSALGGAYGQWPTAPQAVAPYLQVAASPDFNMGLGAFTIEFFFKTTSTGGAGATRRLLDIGNSGAGVLQIWQAAASSSYGTPGGITLANRGGNGLVVDSKRALNDGAWHWVVIQRDTNNRFSMYVDGTLVDSLNTSMNYDDATPYLRIGAGFGVTPAATTGWVGALEELRVTKGIARYSGATIPVPTKEFLYGD